MTSVTHNSDQNAILIQLCIKVLKNVAPGGMTTKELAAELDKEISPGFDGISSSILSSKLNAVFRRSHNDSQTPSKEQLAELPMTRGQSSEIPRRLVYRYCPPTDDDEHKKKTNNSAKAAENTRKRSAVEKEKEEVEEEEEEDLFSESGSPSSLDEENEDLAEPLTPKEENIKERDAWSPTKRRRVSAIDRKAVPPPLPVGALSKSNTTYSKSQQKLGNHTSDTSISPSEPNVGAAGSGHRPQTPPSSSIPLKTLSTAAARATNNNTPSFNLYYDAVGAEALSAALAPATMLHGESSKSNDKERSLKLMSYYNTESESDSWTDLASPESLELNELDKLVC